MSGFSITDAAFTGFRVVREHPKVLVAWGLGALVCLAPLELALEPLFTTITKLPAETWQDSAKSAAALKPYESILDIASLVSLPLRAVLNAAMNRAVLRPSEDRFGYLRLGVDELRQLGLIVVLTALNLLISTGGGLLATLGGTPAITGLANLAALCLWIFLDVRLSLASAHIFQTGRLDLKGAWGLSGGRYWRLFVTYLLALAMGLLVLFLSIAVIEAVAALVSAAIQGLPGSKAWTSALGSMFDPATLVAVPLVALSAALVMPIWLTPPATIYQRLTQAA
jgi:hypothetical protein